MDFPDRDCTWRSDYHISSKRIPQKEVLTRKIKWANIWLFAFIFILAGISSEMARKNNWPHRRPINLFENTYRFGSLVFGGGQVLIPLMYEQFVCAARITETHPAEPEYRKDQQRRFLYRPPDSFVPSRTCFFCFILYGRDRYERSRVFYAGNWLCCRIRGHFFTQRAAGVILFPIWSNLKKYATVYRALEGINAVVVGIMIASCFYMMKDFTPSSNLILWLDVGVGILTLILLIYSKLPSPVIVMICLLLGWIV